VDATKGMAIGVNPSTFCVWTDHRITDRLRRFRQTAVK